MNAELARLAKMISSTASAEVTREKRAEKKLEDTLKWLNKLNYLDFRPTRGGRDHAARMFDELAEMAAIVSTMLLTGSRERANKKRQAVRKALGYTYP